MSRKNIINRVLNRPSESRGSQPSGLLLVLFVEAKRIKPFPFGNFRCFANLEVAHTGGGIAQSQLKSFSAARKSTGRRGAALYRKSTLRVLFGSFCRSKKNGKTFPFRNISPTFKKAGQKTLKEHSAMRNALPLQTKAEANSGVIIL